MMPNGYEANSIARLELQCDQYHRYLMHNCVHGSCEMEIRSRRKTAAVGLDAGSLDLNT